MSSNKSRAEREREKVIQDRCQLILAQMLKDEDNKYCVDCDSKGPRWVSWNLGIFLCIRCAGIHRNLGVHISKVKSVNLDSWTPQQVASLQHTCNSKARAIYEANIPNDFRRPTSDSAMEAFIRNKYEKKKFIAKEWVPTKPPDLPIGWGSLIEQEKQGRAKEAGGRGGAVAAPPSSASLTKSTVTTSSKPAAAASTATAAATAAKAAAAAKTVAAAPTPSSSNTTDLLGLSLGETQTQPGSSSLDDDLLGFSAFVSATPTTTGTTAVDGTTADPSNNNSEADFFNQVSGGTPSVPAAAVDSSKMSKDSILALFGSSSSQPASSQHGWPTTAVSQPASSQPGWPNTAGSQPAWPNTANSTNSAMFGGSQMFGQNPVSGASLIPNNCVPPAPTNIYLQQNLAPANGHHSGFPGAPQHLPTNNGGLFQMGSGGFSGQQPNTTFPPTQHNNLYGGAGVQQQHQQMFGGVEYPGVGGQQQFGGGAPNPFSGEVSQPKMINSLPQNVFQMNTQLSGLSLNPAPAKPPAGSGNNGMVAHSLWQ